MTFEILISTMNKSREQVIEMLKNENIHCNCVVIDQCDENKSEEIYLESRCVKIFYSTERGLSKSRNMALKYATADIVLIADDDLYYYDNFDKDILAYYEKNKNADVVLFNVDSYRKEFGNREKKCSFLESGNYISVQTSLNRNAVTGKIKFNELFGTGSEIFDSGEENIFLADCFRRNLKIFYSPVKILKDEESESTWFHGYNDKKHIQDRGAIYYAMSKILYPLYILRYILLKKNLLKPVSRMQALKLMNEGKKKYKAMVRELEVSR